MFKKVNPSNMDKIADRIAGAMTDIIYAKQEHPIVNINVLINHGVVTVISESSYDFLASEVYDIIERITGHHDIKVDLRSYPPNNMTFINNHCGNTGVYHAEPVTVEQSALSSLMKGLYKKYKTAGIFVINNNILIANQAEIDYNTIYKKVKDDFQAPIINPLGDWASTILTDSGLSNSQLASDLLTSYAVHGRDLTKAALPIYTWLRAQELGEPYTLTCAIGDDIVDGKFYSEIMGVAKDYIDSLGGFEKMAEWGLI